jgi:hypothetical protein
MSDNAGKSEAAARQERLRQQAEHRLIVQAAMQAQRAGKLPKSSSANPTADAITAIVVLVVVIAILVLMVRAGA